MSQTLLKTLIVDDEVELRRSVIAILQNAIPDVTFEIAEAGNGIEALKAFRGKTFDLVLMDVRMPEMDGLETLKQIKELDPRTLVVIMTAHANLNDAVLAIKDGAYNYVEKPVQAEMLTQIVRKALDAQELVSNLALSNPIFDDDIESDFVGNTQKMREVFSLVNRLSRVDTTVLIRGENGTGKELVAQAIHSHSPQKDGPFVAINCGAIPENLMESELFGHEKGAFTGAMDRKIGRFQAAHQGTLFLDEIAELRPEMQVKLLRVLQERKFTPIGSNREIKTNARIIAATNRNLEKMIEDGTFREDLFYRLNVMPIFLPPLRERTDDIPALVQHFIKKFSERHKSNLNSIDAAALDALKKHRWPGNIRELENVIERAFIIENSNQITVGSLPEHLQPALRAESAAATLKTNPKSAEKIAMDFDLFKEGMEKDFIVSALRANRGRINQTVAHANIPKNTLLRKIRKYQINVKEFLEE